MGQYSRIPHQTFSLRREPDFHVWTLSELHRKTSVKAIVYHCYVGMSDVLLLVFWRPFGRVMDCWSRRLLPVRLFVVSESQRAFSPSVPGSSLPCREGESRFGGVWPDWSLLGESRGTAAFSSKGFRIKKDYVLLTRLCPRFPSAVQAAPLMSPHHLSGLDDSLGHCVFKVIVSKICLLWQLECGRTFIFMIGGEIFPRGRG